MSTNSPRVLAYCASTYGLGHERRTLRVLAEIARRVPQTDFLVISGADLTLPVDGFDHLNVLVLPKYARNKSAQIERKAILADTVDSFRPDLIYVDEEPAGHEGELRDTLEFALSQSPRPWLIAGIRDIVNAPGPARGYWQANQHEAVAERYLDYLLVFGDSTLFDPRREYQWSEQLSRKTIMCGYPFPQESIVSAEQIRADFGFDDRPFILVTAGGGMDGSVLIRTALEALHDPALSQVNALVVTGPLMNEKTAVRFAEQANQRPGISVARFRSDLVSCVNAADLVVSMAGANTVNEVAAIGKRSILVPRAHQEQLLRAKLFAELGLAAYLPLSDLTVAKLTNAMLTALSITPPFNPLDYGGLNRAGTLLENLLCPQITPF